MIQIKILNSTRQAPYISNLDVWYHDGFWHQQASPATWWRIWASILIFWATHFQRLFSSLSCDVMRCCGIVFILYMRLINKTDLVLNSNLPSISVWIPNQVFRISCFLSFHGTILKTLSFSYFLLLNLSTLSGPISFLLRSGFIFI